MNIYFNKPNVSYNEYWYHINAYNKCKNLNIPKIMSYNNNVLKMVKIQNMSVADWYGSDWTNLPLKVKLSIHFIIKELYRNGIVYPDISPYNFIEFNKKIWVIDFEHAFSLHGCVHSREEKEHIEFVEAFIGLSCEGEWNPYFM